MANELMIIKNIESRLKKKREPSIFPLTPTHRKELRELKETNVGNLLYRLRTLKELKKEEYEKKYKKQILEDLEGKSDTCNILNKDWKDRLKKINQIVSERDLLESKSDLKFLEIDDDSSNIDTFSYINEIEVVTKKIANEEFDKKFGDKFNEIQKNIDDVTTKYEEAINFGDLEIVKEIYYIMKTADSFFEKVSKIEV